jgi:hypothetical protein
MSRIAGLIQLKTGDAISGVVSRRAPWFRFLRVENTELHEAATQTTTRADGIIFVPKENVLFVQQLVRIAAGPLPAGPATLPGPTLTSETGPRNEAHGTPEARR